MFNFGNAQVNINTRQTIPVSDQDRDQNKEIKRYKPTKTKILKRQYAEDSETKTDSIKILKKQKTLQHFLNATKSSQQHTSTLSTCFEIHKRTLTNEIINQVKKDLTVTVKSWSDQSTTTRTLYEETDLYLRVPRWYGLEKWGPPQTDLTTLGKYMSPNVEFNGQLNAFRKQPEAVQALLASLQDPLTQYCNMLVLPCGFGKTVVAIYVAIEILAKIYSIMTRPKVLIIVHTVDLLKQWIERIKFYAPLARVGEIQGSVCQTQDVDFAVAMIESLAGEREYKGLDEFGLVFFDECHHLAAPWFSQVLKKIAPRHVIGLTATPRRGDKLEHVLHMHLGKIVYQGKRVTTGLETVTFFNYMNPRYKEIKTKKGVPLVYKMHERMIKDPIRNNLIVEQIVRYYLEHPKRQIIVFSKRIEHLHTLKDLLLNYKKSPDAKDVVVNPQDVGFFYSKEKTEKKKEYLQRIETTKKCRIILGTIDKTKEGIDIPTLNTAIFAMPVGDVEQPSGRILRNVEEYMERSPDDTEICFPVIVDIRDPYSIFEGMAWKRFNYYKQQEYQIKSVDVTI